MKKHQTEFNIEKMARMLKISRSNYYHYLHRKRSIRDIENERLEQKIKCIHQNSRGIYGSPRVHAQLKKEGETCSRKRVAKLMRKQGLKAKICKLWKRTTQVNPSQTAMPNYIKQNFITYNPNRVWMSDITYIRTEEGWVYLAVMMDLFSRKVIGLSMENRMDSSLVIKALRQALDHRQPSHLVIHHSDRGSQYTSKEFKNMAKKENIVLSMSGKGHCYDNAVVESFFHTLKTEHVKHYHFKTREEAKNSIFEYIEVFYNKKRSHSSLGYVTPQEFEEAWWLEQNIRVFAV